MARARTVERPTIPAPAKISIVLIVNGAERPLKVAPWTTLLDALRDHLDLTGTKRRAATTAGAAPARSWSTGGGSSPASPSL